MRLFTTITMLNLSVDLIKYTSICSPKYICYVPRQFHNLHNLSPVRTQYGVTTWEGHFCLGSCRITSLQASSPTCQDFQDEKQVFDDHNPHLDTALVNLDLGAVLDLRHHHAPPLLHLGRQHIIITSVVTCHETHLLTFNPRK